MSVAKNPRELGLGVRAMRKEAGMTQAELAESAGVSRRWLITLERGSSGTSEIGKVFDTLQALRAEMTLTPRAQKQTSNKQAQNALAAIRRMNEPS